MVFMKENLEKFSEVTQSNERRIVIVGLVEKLNFLDELYWE